MPPIYVNMIRNLALGLPKALRVLVEINPDVRLDATDEVEFNDNRILLTVVLHPRQQGAPQLVSE
jgi:hypothetical protein